MLDLLAAIPLLFAADAPPAGAAPSAISQLLPFLPIPILFYLLLIRPKQLDDRKRLEMIGALKKNDKVLMASFGAGFTWGSLLLQWEV